MKRFLMVVIVSLATVLCGIGVSAQNRVAVTGGVNFSTSSIKEISQDKMTQFHIGLGYKFDWAYGFSFQPSVLYSVKGAILGADAEKVDFSVGYLELMPTFQWGPDLLIFRPFLDVSPFVGYALNTKADFPGLQEALNRFEYGLGAGVGLEVWRIQLVCRYNWNFGGIASTLQGDGVINGKPLKDVFSGSNLRGITLTASILF